MFTFTGTKRFRFSATTPIGETLGASVMTDHQTNQTFRAIICSCNNADKPNTVLRSRQILNYQNMSKQFLFSILTAGVLATSCNQVTEKAKEETQNVLNQTSKDVQKVIDDLGLVYVEEGAQNIITYEEVNAAQQAWCDALVKIGKLKEEGGDYKGFAEQVLTKLYETVDVIGQKREKSHKS